MGEECADDSDGLDFEDASSGGEDGACEACAASEFLRLPQGVPTKDEVVRQALETRASFQTNGACKVPFSKEIARCGDEMKKCSAPFFGFSRLLAEEQKHAIWSLWGVCHQFDCCPNLNDLREHQRTLQTVFDPGSGAEAIHGDVWQALRASLRRYSVIQRPFQDLADGVAGRLQGINNGTRLAFNTVDDLRLYGYRFGGAIGLIALPVLAEDALVDGDVAMGALALGMALQLTDLLNCVGHHYRTLGNCNIPFEALQRHGIEFSELQQNLSGESTTLIADKRWQALMQELLSPVRPLLQHASWSGEQLPGKGRLAVRVAVRMCMRVVLSIEKRSYDSINRRAKMFTVRTIGDVAGSIFGSGGSSGYPAAKLMSL